MPVDPLKAIEVRTMTEVINDRNKPQLPLTALLFGRGVKRKNLTTESVQLDRLVGSYEMAKFVRKDGKPVSVSRKNFNSTTVETPCMKLKMPVTFSDYLYQRMPGQSDLGARGEQVRKAVLSQISEDMDAMLFATQYRVEWMISQLLQGGLTYSNEDTGAVFELALAKPAGNTFTVGTLWTVETATPLEDINTVKRIVSIDQKGPAPRMALCGKNAASALRLRLEKGWVQVIKTDSGITAGNASLKEQYNDLGMLYIATIGDVEFWEVASELDDDGVVTPGIRDDYIEFIPTGSRALKDRVMHYGRHNSITALENGVDVSAMWARTFLDKDADAYVSEIQSRPLPWWRHPQWYVSMKVF